MSKEVIRKCTSAIVICVTIAVIGWDIFAYMYGENGSVSVAITDWSRRFPSILFIAGGLCSHWFFPARGTEDP